jgi:hypothetical protein
LQLTEQVRGLMAKVSELRQQIAVMQPRIHDLEADAKQVREHYKTYNEFVGETGARLDLLEELDPPEDRDLQEDD